MSKNLTRKGLALGAVVALGSSLFAGTPANANPTAITLASAYGTSTSGLLGEYFYLSALVNGGVNDTALKFYVEGATAATLDARSRSVTALDTSSATTTYVNRTSAIVATDNAAKIATISTPYTAGNFTQLALETVGLTATTVLKVTAFIDNQVADNKPGNGEIVSTPISITYNKLSDVTATPTVKPTTVGSVVKATVALGASVNLEHLRTAAKGAVADSEAVNVGFTTNGSSASSGSNFARWDTTDKEFVASFGSTAAAAGSVYGATAYFGSTASGSATAVTATAGEVSTLGALDFSGTNIKNSSGQKLRAGAGKFTVETEVTAVAAGKLKSGQNVTFKILEVTSLLSDGATITAGGKTITASAATTAQSISVDAVSNASGIASIEVTYAGVKNGDDFNVEATAAPVSGSTAVTSSATAVEAVDDVATAIVDVVESANSSAVRAIARGGAISVPYVLVDQFGQTPTGTFRALVTSSAGSSLGAPSVSSPVAITGGRVTVTGTDTSTGSQAVTVTVAVQKMAADGTWPASNSTVVTSGADAVFNVVSSVAAVSRLDVSQGATTGVARAGITFVAGNEDLEQGTVAHGTLSNKTTMTTTAYSTTGAVAPGASVTLSAPGLLFKSGNVWAIGSITVSAGSNGATPAVDVASNVSGTQTITITSGSVSTTKTIRFNAATTGGTAWTVTAPASILPGQSLRISAVLRDKFGAVVDTGAGTVRVTYTGAGFVTSAIAEETDADGVVAFTVLLGAADAGTSTVRFTYGGADTIAAATTADDIVANASIIIGAAPVAAGSTVARIAGSTNRFFVGVDGNASARNVVVKVAGRTFATLKGSATNRSYAVRAPKGSHKVTVFVGGKLIGTRTIVVR